MKFLPTKISDIVLIEPSFYPDTRGFFAEVYRKDVFAKNGIYTDFVQDNHSSSGKGALRGLHYQIPPKTQAKLVRVVEGEIYDVAVDIRRNSKTFGQYVGEILSAKNRRMMYIPAGFAHGFLALEEGTEILYKVSDFYSPEHERGVLWNDPSIAISWPKLGVDYSLSEKDKKCPSLKESFEAH